eukprot:scaffold83972_cov75-Phaeocystis_antarctica.AAC.1
MQRGGWMAEPRHCADTLKEDTPAGSHARSVGAGSKRRSVGAKRRSQLRTADLKLVQHGAITTTCPQKD